MKIKISSGMGLVLMLLLMGVQPALAKRRGVAVQKVQRVEITLKKPTLFKQNALAAGTYAVRLQGDSIVLVNNKSMRPSAKMKAKRSASKTIAKKISAKLVAGKGGQIRLVVHQKGQLFTLEGRWDKSVQAKSPSLALGARKSAKLDDDVLPPDLDEIALIKESMGNRFVRQVEHCGERAAKLRWKTAQREFTQCVCPMTEKWRLPKPKKTTAVSHDLVKNKNGITLVLNPKGRVQGCSVWSGKTSPTPDGPVGK